MPYSQYNEFVLHGITSLDNSRLQMQTHASSLLTERLDQCFRPAKERVDKFADWYFAYRYNKRKMAQYKGTGIFSPLFCPCFLHSSHDDLFNFSTSFKLLRLATSSLARHTVNFTDRKTLSEAVTLDLGNI